MPTRVRLAALAVTTITVVACGSGDAEDSSSSDTAVQLFDSAVIHEIEVEFEQAGYEAMVETYVNSGESVWIEATVTIDGMTYEQAGLRWPGGSAEVDAPESLPWLIRLDEYVDGQEHQGHEDVVISPNVTETSLNEAVALQLLEDAGLASQQAVSTSFGVNGREPVLRLATEDPNDDAWQEANFEGRGVLYVWDQDGGSDVTDRTPLTEFLQFIDESDDGTFAAELTQRLDVESFATYLAAMEVLGNLDNSNDDGDGPSNDAYLWYDVDGGRFTVVPWHGTLGRDNVLVERFHANAQFETLYLEKLTELRESFYASGVADEVLAFWAHTLDRRATDLVSAETIADEAEAVAGHFDSE